MLDMLYGATKKTSALVKKIFKMEPYRFCENFEKVLKSFQRKTWRQSAGIFEAVSLRRRRHLIRCAFVERKRFTEKKGTYQEK